MKPVTIADLPRAEKEKVSRLVQKLISLGREHELALSALSERKNGFHDLGSATIHGERLSQLHLQYSMACSLLGVYRKKLIALNISLESLNRQCRLKEEKVTNLQHCFEESQTLSDVLKSRIEKVEAALRDVQEERDNEQQLWQREKHELNESLRTQNAQLAILRVENATLKSKISQQAALVSELQAGVRFPSPDRADSANSDEKVNSGIDMEADVHSRPVTGLTQIVIHRRREPECKGHLHSAVSNPSAVDAGATTMQRPSGSASQAQAVVAFEAASQATISALSDVSDASNAGDDVRERAAAPSTSEHATQTIASLLVHNGQSAPCGWVSEQQQAVLPDPQHPVRHSFSSIDSERESDKLRAKSSRGKEPDIVNVKAGSADARAALPGQESHRDDDAVKMRKQAAPEQRKLRSKGPKKGASALQNPKRGRIRKLLSEGINSTRSDQQHRCDPSLSSTQAQLLAAQCSIKLAGVNARLGGANKDGAVSKQRQEQRPFYSHHEAAPQQSHTSHGMQFPSASLQAGDNFRSPSPSRLQYEDSLFDLLDEIDDGR